MPPGTLDAQTRTSKSYFAAFLYEFLRAPIYFKRQKNKILRDNATNYACHIVKGTKGFIVVVGSSRHFASSDRSLGNATVVAVVNRHSRVAVRRLTSTISRTQPLE